VKLLEQPISLLDGDKSSTPSFHVDSESTLECAAVPNLPSCCSRYTACVAVLFLLNVKPSIEYLANAPQTRITLPRVHHHLHETLLRQGLSLTGRICILRLAEENYQINTTLNKAELPKGTAVTSACGQTDFIYYPSSSPTSAESVPNFLLSSFRSPLPRRHRSFATATSSSRGRLRSGTY